MFCLRLKTLLILFGCWVAAAMSVPAAADTVLITGANSGIGLEFAKQYAAKGWTVIATHRHDGTPDSLAALSKQFRNVDVRRMDVQSSAEVHFLAAALKGKPIDVLINNAGIFSLGDWLDRSDNRQHFGTLDYEAFDQFMQINVRGPIMVSEAFVDNVRAGRRKKIIAISSTIGTLSDPSVAVNAFWYGTSKAALNKVMVTLSAVLKSEGIIVVPMHPGSVRVEKQDSVKLTGMLETKDSVAQMIATIDKLTMSNSGRFTLYDGSALPW
jgi:NAD(P)-dependent dehydrogenase (short-subunit alcohol dehydrogenase family)